MKYMKTRGGGQSPDVGALVPRSLQDGLLAGTVHQLTSHLQEMMLLLRDTGQDHSAVLAWGGRMEIADSVCSHPLHRTQHQRESYSHPRASSPNEKSAFRCKVSIPPRGA